MAHRVDFRPMALAADERIVGRHGAVVVEAQDLAAQAHAILRDVRNVVLGSAAGGHVDLAVTAEDDAAVETRVALVEVGDEQVFDVDERVAFEPAPKERGSAHPVSDRLGVGEIDEGVRSNSGWSATSIRPPLPSVRISGNPEMGRGSRTPSRTTRRRPPRSVISMPRSGRNAIAQGCERPLVTTLTRTLCCSAVSKTQGPSPNGGTGTPIGVGWAWLAPPMTTHNAAAHRTERPSLMRTSPVAISAPKDSGSSAQRILSRQLDG